MRDRFGDGNVIPMNLDGAIHLYLERRAAIGEKWRPLTARNTGYLLRSWARHIDGEDWRSPDLDDVLDWAIIPASQDGKHRRLSAVRTFYRHAYQWGWITLEVASRFPKISGAEGVPRPIPDRVFRRALATAGPVDYRALILGRFAGLRAGEIASTHCDHLDGGHLWVQGKGGRERWVVAHPEVARIVSQAEGWVFPGRAGHWRAGTITARLSEVLPDQWTAHSLRHGFATQLYADTRDLKVVAAQLGHKSVTTTERYVRASDDRAVQAIAAWAAWPWSRFGHHPHGAQTRNKASGGIGNEGIGFRAVGVGAASGRCAVGLHAGVAVRGVLRDRRLVVPLVEGSGAHGGGGEQCPGEDACRDGHASGGSSGGRRWLRVTMTIPAPTRTAPIPESRARTSDGSSVVRLTANSRTARPATSRGQAPRACRSARTTSFIRWPCGRLPVHRRSTRGSWRSGW